MNSHTSAPFWRCFENVSPGPEAASAAASCSFSLSTLEVTPISDSDGFALTERKQPEIWRWAIIGPAGYLLEEGFESTKDEAKKAAETALELTRSGSAAGVHAT